MLKQQFQQQQDTLEQAEHIHQSLQQQLEQAQQKLKQTQSELYLQQQFSEQLNHLLQQFAAKTPDAVVQNKPTDG